QRYGVEHHLRHKGIDIDPFLFLALSGIVFRAVGVFAARAEAVEGWEKIPEGIAVAQATAFLGANHKAEVVSGLLPDCEQAIGRGVAWPRARLVGEVDSTEG